MVISGGYKTQLIIRKALMFWLGEDYASWFLNSRHDKAGLARCLEAVMVHIHKSIVPTQTWELTI